jgi:leucyl-tRNA synthetase
VVRGTHANLRRFASLAEEILSVPDGGEAGRVERWLMSRTGFHLAEATAAIETFETRKALQHAFYMMMQDVRRYLARRGERASGKVLREVLDIWVRMLAPFIPHLCEEIWRMMGMEGFVSLARWPEAPERDRGVELEEAFLDGVIDDILEVRKVTGKEKIRTVCIYVADEWKWRVCGEIARQGNVGTVDMGEVMRRAREAAPDLPGEKLAKVVQRMVAEIRKMPPEKVEAIGRGLDEAATLREAEDYIRRQTGAERVMIFRESDPARYDPAGRAEKSLPLRPAIFLE